MQSSADSQSVGRSVGRALLFYSFLSSDNLKLWNLIKTKNEKEWNNSETAGRLLRPAHSPEAAAAQARAAARHLLEEKGKKVINRSVKLKRQKEMRRFVDCSRPRARASGVIISSDVI